MPWDRNNLNSAVLVKVGETEKVGERLRELEKREPKNIKDQKKPENIKGLELNQNANFITYFHIFIRNEVKVFHFISEYNKN